MNAPATPAALAAATKLEQIPIAKIRPSKTHIQELRRSRFDPKVLQELADSIKKVGLLQPIVVRPWNPAATLNRVDADPTHEIVAGERRWAAAKLAGISTIAANVVQLGDEQVLEAQLVENLQRAELQPLEEAAGYEELMKVAKLKPEDLGDKVGKSRSWIYSRLNLLKLDGPARDALQTGRLDVSRAMVVASVGSEEQRKEVLTLALERGGNDKPIYSVRELRQKIVEKQFCLPLVGAPFDVTDAKLVPAVGACAGCRFRTGNCDPEALDPDVCTNLPCFTNKTNTAAAAKRKAILSGGGKVLKGEEARLISPSIKTIYGHVDLDLVCGHDDFPEEMPQEPPGTKRDDYGDRTDGPYLAWQEREKLWQPRTYRALLAGQKYATVVIDDPKTKQLRELVPFKEAARLLKPLGINLPGWANKERPKAHRHSGGGSSSAAEKKKDPAQEAAEQAKRELDEKVDREVTMRILAAVKAKHDGKTTADEWTWCVQGAVDDIDNDICEALWKMYGQKDPGYRCEKAVAKIAAKDLPGLLTTLLLAQGLGDGYGRTEKLAIATMARFKIDRKKIETEVRADLTPKRPVDKVIASIEKRAKKSRKKK